LSDFLLDVLDISIVKKKTHPIHAYEKLEEIVILAQSSPKHEEGNRCENLDNTVDFHNEVVLCLGAQESQKEFN
jgi:hypothetical protein